LQGGIFFMLTPEEEKFFVYWQAQRQHKKNFLRKFSIGLPLFAVLAIVFVANLVSGWYGKADKELRQHSSLVIVILVALLGIGVFMAIFSARHRWEQNESDYQSLLRKKETENKN
jgi:pilus assembly protein TadC